MKNWGRSTSLLTLFLLAFLLAGSANRAFAIDERIMIMPPSQQGELHASAPHWTELLTFYREAMLNSSPIPMEETVAAWTGDTLLIDFYDIDSAQEWGETLEADAVLLSEWNDEGVQLQRLDLWTGEVQGPVQQPTLELALATLEPEKVIFGTRLTDPVIMLHDAGLAESSYKPPTFQAGAAAVHTYMHEHSAYPPDALIQGMSALAEVQVTLSNEGIPVAVKVLSVKPENEEFGPAYEKALWAVAYRPATWRGKPVNSVLRDRVYVYPVQ